MKLNQANDSKTGKAEADIIESLLLLFGISTLSNDSNTRNSQIEVIESLLRLFGT